MKIFAHRSTIGFCALILTTVAAGASDSGPRPPCGGEVSPPYPALDSSPVVRVWDHSELGRDWAPPACTGWTTSGFATLVVTVGRFRYRAGSNELAHDIGAISK